MQVTIARQLGLEPTTVGNFFMNARRRSMDKWKEENEPSPKSNSSNAGSTTPNGIHAGGESDDHDHDVLWPDSPPPQNDDEDEDEDADDHNNIHESAEWINK